MICPLCQAENVDDSEACFTCGRPLHQTPTITRGSVVDSRFEVLSPLGKGGMGMVFKAHDRVLDEVVALKTLRWDVAREPDVARRFRAETKLARKVRHRNVCGIHEYGDAGGLRYIAMELVDGIDLRRLLKDKGPVPTEEAFDMALQITNGLEAIHKAGVIHRDLKTPNIMRDSKGVIRLMDFGIAKQSGSETTLGGQVVGTPEYMSPEQARGHKVSFRSDIYALGIVIFEIFTGRVPFNAETPIATILKQLHEPPPLEGPAAAAIPLPLVPVLRRALQKLPADRYASAREVMEALEQARDAWRNPASAAEGLVRAQGALTTSASGLAAPAQPVDGAAPPSPTETPTQVPVSGAGSAADPMGTTPSTTVGGRSAEPRPRSAWTVALPAAAAAAFVVWVLMRGERAPTPTATPSLPLPSVGTLPSLANPNAVGEEAVSSSSSPLSSPSPRPSASPSRPPRTPAPSAVPPGRVRGPSPSPSVTPETVAGALPFPSPVLTPTPPPAPPATPPPVSTTLLPGPTPRPRPPGVRRGELVRDGPGVKLPRVLTSTPPAYPPAAERLRRDATVVLEALVDENGKVTEVRITRPDPSRFGFNEAAEAAARATTFEPATKDGVPVRMWFPMRLTFTPREPDRR